MKLLLCLVALSAPCLAQSDVAAEMLPPAPKSAATSDAFVWRIQPEVGSRWQMRSFTRVNQTLTVPAMENQPAQTSQIKFIMRMTVDYDVLGRDRFGASTLRLTYRELSSTVQGGQGMPDQTVMTTGKNLSGATFTVKMAPNGEIWNVMGLERAQNALLASYGLSPAELAQTRAITKSLLSPEATRQMVKGLTGGALPSYPIRAGESWKQEFELPAGLPFEFKISGTRTLKSLNGGIAFVADNWQFDAGKLQMETPQDGSVIADMSELEGSYSGASRVDVESGFTLQTTLTQKLQGPIKVTLQPKGAPRQTVVIPTSMTASSNIVMEPR